MLSENMHSDSVYVEVGKAVAIIQTADRLLKGVLLLVFPGEEFNDLALMQKNEKLLNRATLGKLIRILRTRVVLHEHFDQILSQYLEDRNSLIHDWDEIDGWEEESNATAFCIHVQKQAAYLVYVLLGFMRSWSEQTDIEKIDEDYPELRKLFQEIDFKWKPLAREFVEDLKPT